LCSTGKRANLLLGDLNAGITMKWNIILIHLMKVMAQTNDYDLKKKLLDTWNASDNFEDTRDEIVIDYERDEPDKISARKTSEEIIILPFFSDEVLSLDDIPRDTNWNFVEINSDTDLIAMENPHQKKVKTQSQKWKSKSEPRSAKKAKPYNNWQKFKHRFPIFVEKGFKPATLSEQPIMASKKEKRHTNYYPIPTERTHSININKINPWKSVQIVSDDSPKLAFGSYDELGNKIQNKENEFKTTLEAIDTRENVPENLKPSIRQKKEIGNHEQVINITIDLDNLTSISKENPLHPKKALKNTEKLNPGQSSKHKPSRNSNAKKGLGESEVNRVNSSKPNENIQKQVSQQPFQVFRAVDKSSTLVDMTQNGNSNTEARVQHMTTKKAPFVAFNDGSLKVLQASIKGKRTELKKASTRQDPINKTMEKKLEVEDDGKVKTSANLVEAAVIQTPSKKRNSEANITKVTKNDIRNIVVTTPMPVFEVFQANKVHNDKEATPIVLQVFTPGAKQSMIRTQHTPGKSDSSKEHHKPFMVFQKDKPQIVDKSEYQNTGRALDRLYQKLTSLTNLQPRVEHFDKSEKLTKPSSSERKMIGSSSMTHSNKVVPTTFMQRTISKPEKENRNKQIIENIQQKTDMKLLERLKKQVEELHSEKKNAFSLNKGNNHKLNVDRKFKEQPVKVQRSKSSTSRRVTKHRR